MGEYWVSHKRKDEDDIRIVRVKAMEKTKNGLNPSREYTRNQVVESIENTEIKNRWITCRFLRKEGTKNYWNPGEEIHVYRRNNNAFIRENICSSCWIPAVYIICNEIF